MIWLIGLGFAALPGPSPLAAPLLDETTRSLLVQAAEAASALDAYNARCRSDISGRHQDDLNQVLVERLRMTLLSVQDDLFPERSYRAVQARLERDFLTELRQAGGCQGAKESDMPDRLRANYDALLEQVRALP